MPKPSQRADVNTFTGGLVSEASPLNFPPNAMADGVNFELHRDGRVTRRLGMDLESAFSYNQTIYPSGTTLGYGTFRWEQAGGFAGSTYLVVQSGSYIYFYDLNQASISGNGVKGQIIAPFPNNINYSFASVDGLLVIAAGQETVNVVDFDGTDFIQESYRLQTRDLWGIEETIDTNYETDPTYRGTDNGQHRYNLMNQSWGIPRKSEAGVFVNPLDFFSTPRGGQMPNNSEQVWTGLQFQAVSTNQVPFERMYNNLYDESLGGKFTSAKGYFIIDLLRRGTSRLSAAARNTEKYPLMTYSFTPPSDYSPGGAKCVAQFAGRVFYAGFSGEVIEGDRRSPSLNNYVFFSQLVKNRQDISKCYQDGDPTAREDADIVDTDGGFVKVSGAANIIAMRALGINLVVFAENGTWLITGGTDNQGFSATSYKVNKISSFGVISDKSIIVENDSAFYWASDGIYSITRNQFGDYGVNSITLDKIQTLYESIPNQAKRGVFGEYDEVNKKLRWVYKEGTVFSPTSNTKELVFDSLVSAFTINQISNLATNNVEIVSAFRTLLTVDSSISDTVLAVSDIVLSNTDPVVVEALSSVSNRQFLKYLVVQNVNGVLNLTFSEYNNTEWTDWQEVDGVGMDAKAFCLTGDQTAGDSAADKQVPYLVMSFIRTESGVDSNYQPLNQSSCFFRMQWNFANAVQSNKWTPLWQAYRYRKALYVNSLADNYDSGFSIIQSKNKVRGRGKAFALYFETEAKKDCQIAGWNLTVNGNKTT